MKTFRNLIALSLFGLLAVTPLLKSQAQIIAAPMPDLVITKITEAGLTTKVTVKNVGSANAPACKLRGYFWNGALWQAFDSFPKNVNALPVGASQVISITDLKVGSAFNKYFIDSATTVAESHEGNNLGYYPPPAG